MGEEKVLGRGPELLERELYRRHGRLGTSVLLRKFAKLRLTSLEREGLLLAPV